MNRMQRFFATSARVIALFGTLFAAQASQAAPVLFNAAGGGASGAALVSTFDELPGNALALGAQPLINAAFVGLANGQSVTTGPFTLYYQANVSLIGPGGNIVNTDGNVITAVAKFQETATVTGGSNTVTFNLAANQTGSYFDFFAKTGGAIGNNATGIGFANDTPGTLIYSATVPTSGSSGNFTNNGGSTNLDQNGPAGQQTVNGTGASQLGFVTAFVNANYFVSNPGSLLAFSTTNTLPFNTTVPSSQFVNLTGAGAGSTFAGYVLPSLGTLNGSNGRDVQFQADGSSSFPNAVPEPASVAMTLLGFAGMGIGSVVARRRRAQA